MSTQAYVPRRTAVLKDTLVSHEWDVWFQNLANRVNTLTGMLLSGPDADPTGIVVASPGALYTRVGATTSKLWIKESGVNNSAGWVMK